MACSFTILGSYDLRIESKASPWISSEIFEIYFGPFLGFLPLFFLFANSSDLSYNYYIFLSVL